MDEDAPEPSIDRRPLASRDTALAHRAAGWLIRRNVSPNAISVASVFAGVGAGAALAATASWPELSLPLWLLAAVLVQLRLLCNMLDGMVAVGSGQTSPVGELYNEVPDRLSDAATLVGLGYAAGGAPWLGYTAALTAMLTAYVRAVGKASGASNDFRGPMAKPHRMFVVTVTALYVAIAPATWQPRLAGMDLPALTLALIAVGSLYTAARRLLGIARQLRGGRS